LKDVWRQRRPGSSLPGGAPYPANGVAPPHTERA
jgi:hypothetical protein